MIMPSMPTVQSEAINAIGLLCRATKDDFAPFFHTIVQGLINILSGPVVPDNITVHSSASMCLCTSVEFILSSSHLITSFAGVEHG